MKATIDTEDKPSRGRADSPGSNLRAGLCAALLCVGVSAIAVIPFFFMGEPGSGLRMPTTHDMFLHYDQMRSFYAGLSSGQLYPRWEEDTNYGFGAPTPSYYPPGVYYVTAACYLLAGDWMWALLLAHLLMMALSGAAFYLYARSWMSRGAAAVGMCLYVVMPYHLIDVYQRGAMAELMGFVWMPLMLVGIDRLMSEGGQGGGLRETMRWVGVLGLSYGGFVWSHPPTAYQFSLVVGMYVVMKSVMRRRWGGMVKAGAGMMLGLALSAAYLLPAYAEQDLIHHEYITETWPYHNSYVFAQDQFNYQTFKQFFDTINAIWILSAAAALLAALVLWWLVRRRVKLARPLRHQMILWIVTGLLASFMMTRASEPIGRLIPKIEIGVFSWRMLSISTLAVALLAGGLIEAAGRARSEQGPSRLLVALAGIIAAAGLALSVIVVAPATHAAVFVPEEVHLNPATLPASAPLALDELPDDVPQAELAEDDGTVTVERWDPEHRVISVNLAEEDTLFVRTFNFPGWAARVDGRPADIMTGEDYGDIEIDLGAGSHTVALDYLDTPVRKRATYITIASFAFALVAMAAPLMPRGVKRVEGAS